MERTREILKEKLSTELNIDFDCYSSILLKDLLEIHTKIIKSKSCTLKELATVLECEHNWLRKKIFSAKQDVKKLRGVAKNDYLNETLNFNKHETQDIKRPSTSQEFHDVIEITRNETLRKKIEDLEKTVSVTEINVVAFRENNLILQRANKELERSIDLLRKKFFNKQDELKVLKRRQKILIRSLQRKSLKMTKERKANTDLKRTVSALKKTEFSLDKKNKILEEKNKELTVTLNRMREEKSEEQGSVETSDQLKQEIQTLKENLTYAESLLEDVPLVETFDNETQSYTTDTQLCIMNLLSEGVGVHHVNKVITSVAQFCGKEVSKLPSVSTINRIGDQRASVSYMQMEENLKNKVNTTLQSDETRKHGEIYEVFSVRDSEKKEWVLGLKDMKDKSSQTCLNTLKSVIEDISSCTSTESGETILLNIKNTMSDRAATEKKFHELLHTYRQELLPLVYSNWDQLSEEEKESITCMNNFYCGLHILVNFAEVSDTIIKEYESVVKGDEFLGAEAQPDTKQFTEKGESGTVRLVRTASKCFARGGDDKSGCYLDFKTFLSTKYGNGKKKVSHLLVPFRGNRFNILFYNAEVVFFLADDIKEFFTKVSKPTNRLQKAVAYDINVDMYMAILKALGICSKLVTAPFWRAIEHKQCSLEEASTIYQRVYDFLEKAKEDSSEVLSGISPFAAELVNKNDIYERLKEPDDFDPKTIVVLQQIFTVWSNLLVKAASDHLCGGKFSDFGDILQAETTSTPRHNKFPERVFALLDALTRYRPVASTLCNEAYIMFSLNKTGDWVNSLSSEKKEMYLNKARREGRVIRRKYLQRIREIEESQKETLKEKRGLIEKKEKEQVKLKERLVNDMLYFGLWQYPETVDQMLKGYTSESEKKKALKTQLQFRKTVLEQGGDKKLFQMSEKGKAYTVERLIENVKILIQDSLAKSTPLHESILIGKRILHYQMVQNNRTAFPGRVVSTVPGYPQWYNIVYDGDDAVYVYKLQEDYNAGDLEILIEELVEPPQKKRKQ